MAFEFPSEKDLDDICRRNSVPKKLFQVGDPLHSRLPQFGPVLSAVEQSCILALKHARMQLEPISENDLNRLKYFIRNTCDLSRGGVASLFRSAISRGVDLTPKGYEDSLEINKRVFGEYLNDFKEILRDDLGADELRALGTNLLSRISVIASDEVYVDPRKVLDAYNELKSLPGYWERLIESAEAICGKLAELELSDAKLAGKIQKELNDKLEQLYNVNKDSVTLNDVAAVLTDIKSLPELDPLLRKTVK